MKANIYVEQSIWSLDDYRAFFDNMVKTRCNYFQAWTSNNDPTGVQSKFKYNEFAASFGGPVIKDKLWYFVSAQQWEQVTTPLGAIATSDRKTPRFTWWSWSQFGKKQWVQQNLDKEKTVIGGEVYWFDETPAKADCRVPKSWRLLYKDGEQWKEVRTARSYGVEVDQFNVVTFDPAKTTAMRLEVQCQERRSAGVYEWRIKTRPE
jgi:hypothetical protein